jgi:hypothetical protein
MPRGFESRHSRDSRSGNLMPMMLAGFWSFREWVCGCVVVRPSHVRSTRSGWLARIAERLLFLFSEIRRRSSNAIEPTNCAALSLAYAFFTSNRLAGVVTTTWSLSPSATSVRNSFCGSAEQSQLTLMDFTIRLIQPDSRARLTVL